MGSRAETRSENDDVAMWHHMTVSLAHFSANVTASSVEADGEVASTRDLTDEANGTVFEWCELYL